MTLLAHATSSDPALIDAVSGRVWSHAELAAEARERAAAMPGPKAVALVRCGAGPDTIFNYLAAREAGHAALLVDAALPGDLLARLIEVYAPRFVDGTEQAGAPADGAVHSDLALLLSTSGTTGSPKLVRLSSDAVLANARSIASYLGLGPGDRAIASLPLHYCFGLSVLHSHLVAGGAIVLPEGGLVSASFWEAAERFACTSFAGVPYSYELLRRTGKLRALPPSLRTMTQAGGRLPAEQATEVAAAVDRLFVMYGQTEATARMAYVPPEMLALKPGSIGVPIPGGRLEVVDGELVYEGPNVMMGYALSREDLACGDVCGGRLATGDLGHADDEAFFYVTGRSRRFAKVYGLRINLDEVEQELRAAGPVAAVGHDEQAVVVYLETGADPAAAKRRLAERYRLTPRTFDVRVVDQLPTTSAGKIDYGALAA
jgi:acyl-coenzyme A synthetase/AMP-(fatty) acid ligase